MGAHARHFRLLALFSAPTLHDSLYITKQNSFPPPNVYSHTVHNLTAMVRTSRHDLIGGWDKGPQGCSGNGGDSCPAKEGPIATAPARPTFQSWDRLGVSAQG